MWALFGFSTLILSIVMLAMHRYDAKWSGLPWKNCYYKEGRNSKNKKLYWIQIGVPTNSALDFELKTESWLDRFFKKIGLSKEGLVGKDSLERNIYIVSDDDRVFSVIQRNANLHTEFHYFFSKPSRGGFKLKRMVCRAGKLRVHFKVLDKDADHLSLVEAVQPHLAAIERQLPRQLLSDEKTRDPYFLKSILILATSSGLAINGFLQLLRLGLMNIPFVVDKWQLWSLSLVYAGFVLFVLVTGTVVLLARTSRAHLVLLEVILVGGIGAVLSCVVHVRDINIELDAQPAKVFSSKVLGKHISRSRKSGNRYYITLAAWNETSGKENIKVSSYDYVNYDIGNDVNIYQKPGFLNIRWVENIEKKQSVY